MCSKGWRKALGFTLIEVMIAVAVVAILAAIAYPSYRRSVIKSRRSDAKVALSQTAQEFERCYSEYGTYDPSSASNCPPVTTGGSITSPEGYYTITATALTDTTYKLQATPTPKGGQDEDSQCAVYTLDQTGNKTASTAPSGGTDTTSTCW